jgi:hypothetical protein
MTLPLFGGNSFNSFPFISHTFFYLQLYSQCLELENDLIDKSSKDHDLKRARLKDLYSLLSHSFIDFASANASEDRLWKYCFQRPIDTMTAMLKKVYTLPIQERQMTKMKVRGLG